MLNALKKIDKKVLIIVGIILLLPILLIIFLAIIQGCSNKKDTFESYEEKMISAAKEYFTDNKQEPKEEGELVSVDLNTLVSKNYIKNAEESLEQDSCSGNVTVRKNGSIVEENNGGFLNYIVNLNCNDYNTNTLKDSIMEDLTPAESGLYQVNNRYIYKGDDVDNYIKFFGKDYRIISIDENGLVKLLKSEKQDETDWDMKYNIEVNDSYGKNIYKDSNILKSLLKDYNNNRIFSEDAKKRIVSNSVCIDSRDEKNYSKDVNCSNYLENQVISLISINDFSNASLDVDCVGINSKSCKNYNYLSKMGIYSWTSTALSNNTYEVFYLSNGIARIQEASNYSPYSIVIYIDGNESFATGDGSINSPYVIE